MFLEKRMKNEILQAKAKVKKGDKRGAMMHLKRKKMYEKEVAKMDAVQLTLEQQVFAIEGAQTNVEAVNAMKVGKDQMQSMQAAVNVDDVADLRDEIEEQQANANEVSDLLAEGMGAAAMMDEDDLLAELDELDAEDASAAMLAAPSAPVSLPSAPTRRIEAKGQEEDEDAEALAELQAMMA